MSDAIWGLSTTSVALIVAGAAIVLAVIAGFIGRALVRRGLREPFVVRLINRSSERVISVIKRPITVAVLDEVAAVLQAGHYTRNIASALTENHEEIKEMIAEKIKADPTTRHVGLLPLHNRVIDEITETTLRVVHEVLADPRTDELIADLLRDNVNQIRTAVRARQGP